MGTKILIVIILYRYLVLSYVYPNLLGFGDDVVIRASWLDLWAFAHIASGVFTAALVKKLYPTYDFWRQLVTCGFIWMCWEHIEMCQEAGYTFQSAIRFHGGLEHPVDRLIFDPLMGVLGVLWYNKTPRVLWVVTPAGIAWSMVNIYLGTADGVERLIRSCF